MGDTIIIFIAAGLGILIGYNMRNEYARKLESKTIEEIDKDLRDELVVAKNLNKSLMDDIKFLREKIKRLNG